MTNARSLAESLRQDAHFAIRSLLRTPGYTVTAILSLALGIGASIAAFSVVDAIRFRSLPFPDADRLIVLSEVPATGEPVSASCGVTCDVSYVTFSQLLQTRHFQTITDVAGFTGGGKVYSGNGEPMPVQAGVFSPNLFALLQARAMRGRLFTAEDDRLGVPLVTVLSHDLWVSTFGSDPAIVGKTIKLSDSFYTVVGIMQPGFDFEVGSKAWLPAVPTLDPSTRPSIRSLNVIARLAPGRTIEQARSELALVTPVATGSGGAGTIPMKIVAAPLRDRYVASTQSHDVIFAGMVGCVLLIACANLANLSLVRTLGRQREFAVRTALGAGTRRLARLLLVQHLILVAVATAAGVIVARWLLDLLQSAAVMNAIRPAGMEYRIDGRAALFATLLAVAISAFLSWLPTRVVARGNSSTLLREGAPSGFGKSRRAWMQQAFVAAQIASVFVLVTGAGLLTKAVIRLSHVDLGFNASSVIVGSPSYPHPWRVKEKYMPVTQRILTELQGVSGARAVGLRASVPLGGPGKKVELTVDGARSPLPAPLVPPTALSVSADYFNALGIPVRKGRVFGDQDVEAGMPVAVINEFAARRWWPGEDAIGRIVRADTGGGPLLTLTVVGVVADNRAAQPNLLFAESGPELYRPYLQAPSAFPTFLVSAGGSPTPLLRPVRTILIREVPDRPVGATLATDLVTAQLRSVRVNALQVFGVAAVGLLLALVGLHGLLAYIVRQRTRELGIRSAIGASRASIVNLVVSDAMRLTVAGVLIGLPAAVAASRFIEGLLHGTSPVDPQVYLAVAVGVVAVSLFACAIPTLRAIRIPASVALRDET